MAEAVSAQLGGVEFGRQRVALVAQLLDAAAAGGSGGGKGQFRRTGCEPFDLLQLDTVPGWVADHGVEAADWLVILPAVPDARESGFPVQDALAVGDLFGGAPHFGEGGPEAALPDRVCGIIAVGAMRQE